MIAKGVRFNAEKKCVGNYMSTKIYEFSMKCHLCGNKIIVRADPESCEYKYLEGAYRFAYKIFCLIVIIDECNGY